MRFSATNKTNNKLAEHCTPVCRFMKPVPSGFQRQYQIPDIAVQ